MLQQILKYWYQQEYFTPCWPVNINEDINLIKSMLPWQDPQTNPNIKVSYDVYFGRTFSRDLIKWMYSKLNKNIEDTHEKDNSLLCLCALKIDEEGKYIDKSFSISSFAWAISKLVNGGSINAELRISDLEMLQQEINTTILLQSEGNQTRFKSKDCLYEFCNYICNQINIDNNLFARSLWARKKIVYANKEGAFPPIDPSTELMQSFYLKDIKKIMKQPTNKVNKYVQSMVDTNHTSKRVDIDSDIMQMKKWLKAENYPLGIWPSKNNPSLMQQIGINIALSDDLNIFSINGPPGTGKTTLLKEIIVSSIINRAIELSKFDQPDNAFSKQSLHNPPDQYNQYYYKLDERLTRHGIIVASNNNAAVENISVELPKIITKDRTNRFTNGETNYEDTYFADVASELLNEPAWGLISAKLGNKNNIKNLKKRLWWAADGITLKHYFESDAPDWTVARKKFDNALQAVIKKQSKIAQAQHLLDKHDLTEKKYHNELESFQETYKILVDQQMKLKIEQENLNRLEKTLALKLDNVKLLKSNISIFKRLLWKLFIKSPIIQEWKQVEKDIEETIIYITRQKNICHEQDMNVETARLNNISAENSLQKTKQDLDSITNKIEPYKSLFKENWAGPTFWNNISTNEQSQTSCPWTYSDYDTLREELFYQALMLHKAFILSSKCVKQNLMRLFSIWDNKLSVIDCETAHGSLINTLLLIIPVISTTFASVQTFLEGVKPEELGVLIIDESGQATPQSALGAIWRSKKAIIVGDPLQVEPIVTIPNELRIRFANENNINPIYRLPELSVQMLADQLNPYGSNRKLDGDNIWIGCPLLVHRRCLNPMFQISNRVAYNDKMIFKTLEPNINEKFLLDKSVWFDIKGTEKGNKNHTVQQQTNFIIKLLTDAITIYNGLPNLYIITPFTSVEQSLKIAIRPILKKNIPKLEEKEINTWLKENCGTIHTFQGKEANEVLLVLGCDTKSGKGAAHWVGQKPNIINVAVSRAKYRLGIIGDYNLWSNIPHVQIASKYLPLIKDHHVEN